MTYTTALKHCVKTQLFITFFCSCGGIELSEKETSGEDELLSSLKSAVVNGTRSSDDCYDVAFMTVNGPSLSEQSWCSSFRIAPGVYITAAHCVIPTRPDVAVSTWDTPSLTFTSNPVIGNRTFVDQQRSVTVMVPPETLNFSKNDWMTSPLPNDAMIAMDMAVVVTSDTTRPWDRYQGQLFIGPPAIGSGAYVAGYGFVDKNKTDGKKRSYGYISLTNVANGIMTFRGDSVYLGFNTQVQYLGGLLRQ